MLACEAIVGAVLPVSCARRVVVLIFLLPVLLIWFLARQRIDHWTKLPFVQRQCGAVSWLPYPHPYHRRLRRWIPNPTFRKKIFVISGCVVFVRLKRGVKINANLSAPTQKLETQMERNGMDYPGTRYRIQLHTHVG